MDPSRFREGAPEPIHVSVARPRGGGLPGSDCSGAKAGATDCCRIVIFRRICSQRPYLLKGFFKRLIFRGFILRPY